MGRLNFENKTENRRNLESKLEKRKEEFVRNNLLSDEFIEFVQKNKKPFDTLMSYYQCAIMEVETKFKVLSEEYSLEYDRNPIENIKSRVKSFDSLLKKIRRKNIPLTMTSIEENIQDIAGVRVICSFPDDIYRLADCLLSQDDIILLEKKDYIKNPKPSGYRSLHLIIQTPIFLQEGKRMVTVEVQLRTIAMDFWASLEHKLRYKKNISEEQSVFLAEEMSQCAEISASLDERMQKVKDMLIQSEEESKGPEKSTRLLNLINR
ncbi:MULTISPECIES: GTP pyrophosphokinase [Clostridia]|jgi:putative GTP pyrophosphokinase|uniref:GTP pyrophosphokinase n=1 Tax=Clostridia TaxID=186801 RepID=UPI000E5270DC|nr:MULTISPECIES: GTP pyrophosphokinase family protein [Clostridia]RGH40009.1 GTP pyrophosphokinase family protein [Firmicutes bacterium AM41-5BH]RKQ28734.1 GTP pyrophosphokinase family protein [Ruminococcus sp. B05]TAP33642.1 GTP pyrophosphokinase family protein [Mediterraneibacter sp. gm002]